MTPGSEPQVFDGLHPLLQRQLSRFGIDATAAPDARCFAELLVRVSRSYQDADQERYLLDRALQVSSRELQELNAALRRAAAASTDAIVSAIGDGICVVDGDGAAVLVNGSAAMMLGELASALTGARLLDRLRLTASDLSHESEGSTELLRIVRESGSLRVDEGFLVTFDDEVLPIAFVLNPLQDDLGRCGAVLVFHDRTPALVAMKQLAWERERAEAASKAKSSFLATMSHEIRTPLNGVLGMMQLLLRTDLQPKQRDFAEAALAAGDSLLKVLGDILDFSKIEAGKLELESVDFDLDRTIDEVVDLFAEPAACRGIDLECRIALDLPRRWRGDPGRLRQVVMNLVGNALKFTREGRVSVEVGRPTDGHPGTIEIAVTDTGPGMSQAQQERLFRAFTQADASTTRQYGGTGLGLAICKTLVEAMGGTIGVGSTEGRGSTFWFSVGLVRQPVDPDELTLAGHTFLVVAGADTSVCSLQVRLLRLGAEVAAIRRSADFAVELRLLPPHRRWLVVSEGQRLDTLERQIADPDFADVKVLLTAANERIPQPLPTWVCGRLRLPPRPGEVQKVLGTAGARRVACSRQGDRPRRSLHVLLVEDNMVNQTVARRMLEALGHSAHIASNGVEALAAVQRHAFDLVLMDCQMPEMDGIEATRRIRAMEGGVARLPIVAMTANVSTQDREHCLAIGMDGFLAKPVRIAELSGALEAWVDGGARKGD